MAKKKDERIKEYVNKMTLEVDNYYTEAAHGNADDLLCILLIELGYKEVVDEYNNVAKWYA